MYKLAIISAVVALSYAAGPPAYGAPAPYHPAPAYKEEKLPPQPFAYEYGVADDYSKNNFRKTETLDAEVTYEGTPVYPPEPKEGYGHAAPVYAPAPAYH